MKFSSNLSYVFDNPIKIIVVEYVVLAAFTVSFEKILCYSKADQREKDKVAA